MYLDAAQSIKLLELGFKRKDYQNEIAPFDFYLYKNDVWTVGGNVYKDTLLSCEGVYKEGVWLLQTNDLLEWLEDNGFKFVISYEMHGLGYRIEVINEEGKTFKAKGISSVLALGNVIEKILKTK